ncbi:MAG: segregation/condensation protein A, partial [Chlorobi bacterium]|nr:segregation/condensation protein A [Chlorobiota bacterium]
LVMASTLMYIKTQMLLPQVLTEDGEELEDPRTLLMQRLIEYKQFKEAARDLRSMREDQRYTYYRYLFTGDQQVVEQSGAEHYKNSTLFDLMKAFKAALDRAAETPSEHLVNLYQLTVGEKRTHIIDLLRKKPRIGFFELTENMQKDHVIVTFLAVLDLIKLNKIIITQSDLFDDISISARTGFNLN